MFNLLVVSALFFATIYWFGSLLLNFGKAPDTYLLHLQIANQDSSDVYPLVLVSNDEINEFGKKINATEIVDVTPSDSTQGDRATSVAIENAIRDKLPKLKQNDIVFLYLRGYCIVRNANPFLVVANYSPADDDRNSTPSGLVDLRKLIAELSKLPAAKVVVMLDHADLDVSNLYQLQEPLESFEIMRKLADAGSQEKSTSGSRKNADVIILSAKDDFQPSHIRWRDRTSPASTLFFFALNRAIDELQPADNSTPESFSFSPFVEHVHRYVTLGSGSYQSPVILRNGQRLDPKSADKALAFEFGKIAAKKATTPSSSTATSSSGKSPSDSSLAVDGDQLNKDLERLQNQWKQTESLFQTSATYWPTDFAPYSWHQELTRFRKMEFRWLTSTDSPPNFPTDINSWIDPQSGPTSKAPVGFANAWSQFLQAPYSRAWLFDVAKLPEECSEYPYRPATNLTYDRTKKLSRELARDGNYSSDWIRLIASYPNQDASTANELSETARKHIAFLLDADELWQQLKQNPNSASLEDKNKTIATLDQSRKLLFQTTNNSTAIDREIERLKTNAELTIWQLHHRCRLLLRFAQLTAAQRIELLRLCQKGDSPKLPPTNLEAPSLTTKDILEKSSAITSRFLQATQGVLRPALDSDLHCIVRPTLDSKIEFVTLADTTSATINPTTLTLLRTITPQTFSLQIQRRDGSAPPDELSVLLSGLSDETMRVQQAGQNLSWDKLHTVRVLNGTISFQASAQKQDDVSLPKIINLKLTDSTNADAGETNLERRMGVEWPLQNEFVLQATRQGTTQEFKLSSGEPLLGAALVDEQGEPIPLSYELSLYNRSRISRKAIVQFYQVDDPRQGIVVPGTAFNAERRALWTKNDLLAKVSNWKKLLPQPLTISAKADETISLTSLIANAMKPAVSTSAASPASTPASDIPEIDAPYGLICELKELDENDQVKGQADTTFVWIPLDTYDPFTSNQALRCLTEVPPFFIDDNGKLLLSFDATETLRNLATTPKVPIQIEFQARNSTSLTDRQSFSFDLDQPVRRELPISKIKDDLFIAHISFGAFPKQASYVFQNGLDPQPIRKPEVFAQLESLDIQSGKPNSGTSAAPTQAPPSLLVRLTDENSSEGSQWALINSEADLRKSMLVGKINAVLPAQQAFVAWRIFDSTRNQAQPLNHFYEQVQRQFKVRFDSSGTLQLKHVIAPLKMEFDVENTFEQPGVYELQLFADEWKKLDLVTGRDVTTNQLVQSETIIVDREPPQSSTIDVKDSEGNSIVFDPKLSKNQTYQVVLSLPRNGRGDVPIKEVFFGIDLNDDGLYQDDEAIKEGKGLLNKESQSAGIEYKVPPERINNIRFVARSVDYAGNIQNKNTSPQFTIDANSGLPDKGMPSKAKNYTLTVVVKNTSGSTPSSEVELKMDGRSYSSKNGRNVFIYKNIPSGSYQVTATSSAGSTQYEVSEKIDVSGDNTNITRELKLKTKEKPPAKQP